MFIVKYNTTYNIIWYFIPKMFLSCYSKLFSYYPGFDHKNIISCNGFRVFISETILWFMNYWYFV